MTSSLYKLLAAAASGLARPRLQPLVRRALNLLLRAYGYDNAWDLEGSGEARLIAKICAHNPGFCIDVGANVGVYAAALLKHGAGEVLAFEPLPANLQALSRLQAAHPGRLSVAPVALGAREGEAELHHGAGECTLGSISAEVSRIDYVGRVHTQRTRVVVTTLDAYFSRPDVRRPKHIDFMKIDVEGAEREVLIGARATLARTPPKWVQLEYNRHHLFTGATLRELADLLPGYTVWQLLPGSGGLVRRDPQDPLSNVFARSNWLFVRGDCAPP